MPRRALVLDGGGGSASRLTLCPLSPAPPPQDTPGQHFGDKLASCWACSIYFAGHLVFWWVPSVSFGGHVALIMVGTQVFDWWAPGISFGVYGAFLWPSGILVGTRCYF